MSLIACDSFGREMLQATGDSLSLSHAMVCEHLISALAACQLLRHLTSSRRSSNDHPTAPLTRRHELMFKVTTVACVSTKFIFPALLISANKIGDGELRQ